MRKSNVLILAAITFCLLSEAQAQPRLLRSVFGNGGTSVSNGSNQIRATVGQTIIGKTNQLDSGFWYQNIDIITSVEQLADELIPTDFQLEQNYPNPFNPSTTIQFALPVETEVSLKLYDILGREVASLIDEELPAGIHKLTFEANGLPSGVYFYRIQTDGFVKTRKLTLLK